MDREYFIWLEGCHETLTITVGEHPNIVGSEQVFTGTGDSQGHKLCVQRDKILAIGYVDHENKGE